MSSVKLSVSASPVKFIYLCVSGEAPRCASPVKLFTADSLVKVSAAASPRSYASPLDVYVVGLTCHIRSIKFSCSLTM
ncbi:unnamed protein product [Brassica rapa subsp. trilocularis]